MQVSSSIPSFASNLPFERVFCELYVRQRPALLHYVFTRVHCPAAAEDICQDVFTKFWFQREKYKGLVADYRAFLFRIAHNEAINYLRREKQGCRVLAGISKQYEQALNLTEQMLYEKELEVLLQQAIQGLSSQRRRVYVLCRLEGIKLHSVARMLGLSVCAVKETMRLSNAQVRGYISERMHLNRNEKHNRVR